MNKIPFLAELLMTRFYHDFAGHVGVVNNCAELILCSNDSVKNNALSLLTENAQKLVNKFKFYRYAYSTLTSLDRLRAEEILELSRESLFLLEKNIVLKIHETNNRPLESSVGKILICLIILAYSNVINKGNIVCYISSIGSVHKIVVQAINGYQKINKERLKILKNDKTKEIPDVFNCHEYYLLYLIESLSCNIVINKSSSMLEYTVEIKL